MTFVVERLAELRRHLDHPRQLRPRVHSGEDLRRDLSLHNDVLFSLLTVCQLVIDIAGELSGRNGLPFGDDTEAVQNLDRIEGIPPRLAGALAPLPGFRNVLIHEYVEIDLERVVAALDELGPIDRFVEAVGRLERH